MALVMNKLCERRKEQQQVCAGGGRCCEAREDQPEHRERQRERSLPCQCHHSKDFQSREGVHCAFPATPSYPFYNSEKDPIELSPALHMLHRRTAQEGSHENKH